MSTTKNLSHICLNKLGETYHILYEKQYKLGISDEYLLSTTRSTPEDDVARSDLVELLRASKIARDNILTWYLQQTLVELNVTISLLTAKIKFIEYKLGLCDGLDLHQACSLSLVDFCNILADLTVIRTSPSQRKTFHKISAEVNIPVWLSHYRNQICHVPSEAPCIAILVPLVQKSLQYMRDSFWSKILERETFDEKRFKKVMLYVSRLTQISSTGKEGLQLNKNINSGERKLANKNLNKYSKVCLMLRRSLTQNPQGALDLLTRFMISSKFGDESRNNVLLLVQLIYAKRFEQFVFKMITFIEQNPSDEKIISWLKPVIALIGSKDEQHLRENLSKMGFVAGNGMGKFVDLPPIKCCQIAYRLMKLDGGVFRALLAKLRYKLLPVLGKKRVMTLIRMTAIIGHDPEVS